MPRALTSFDIETIRWHAGRGVKPGTIAAWYEMKALEVRAILNETAPSGAPAGVQGPPVNAGPDPAAGEIIRPIGPPPHSLQPVTLPHRIVSPPVAPTRSARRGSALELAEIAAAAVRAGQPVTRCPAAVVAETQGVTIDPADAAAMRSRHDAMRDADSSWRGRKAAPSTTSPTA